MSTHFEPLKYCPEDLDRLREKEAQLDACAEPPNTQKAYRQAWQAFEVWCRDWRRCDALPASSAIVRDYIVWATQMRNPPYSPATVKLHMSAIRRAHVRCAHPHPMDESVAEKLRNMMRQAARSGARPELAGKKHLTVEQLKKISKSLATDAIDIRDRALLLVGFVSALRRSDLSGLTVGNTHVEEGRVRLWVPFSKTDQRGNGRDVFLHAATDADFCPVRALEQWRQIRLAHFGHFRGPLFTRFRWSEMTALPMSGQAICDALKRRLQGTGVDPDDYGAHSLRSGMITAADAAGATVRAIMDRSGHKSLETVMRYIKSTRGSDPLAGVL